MSEPSPVPVTASCVRHRELVARALGDDADDATLEAYAAEVPRCPDCRRALATHLVMHPALLDPENERLAGMAALRQALDRPVSRGGERWVVAGLALAMAAGALWVALAWWSPAAAPSAVPHPRVAAVRAPPEPPAPSAPVAEPTPLPVPEIAATPVPVPRVAPRAAPAPVPEPTTPVADDAVAEADWPAPPYEDLVGGGAKGVEGAVHAVQLVVAGGHAVGQTVGFVIVSSAETELAVCVDGPERGVVWRGAVPAGRTDLTLGGRLASFAYAAPGAYRFSVSTSDLAGCSAPVHVVEVEVTP